jgi:hypothetical protein
MFCAQSLDHYRKWDVVDVSVVAGERVAEEPASERAVLLAFHPSTYFNPSLSFSAEASSNRSCASIEFFVLRPS